MNISCEMYRQSISGQSKVLFQHDDFKNPQRDLFKMHGYYVHIIYSTTVRFGNT